jgi:hypothetical protein
MDTLLLSRCSYVVKCHAAVGEMALTLSPKLEFVDLNYAVQPFQARSRLARALTAPAIWILCALWSALSEGGMGLSKVAALDGDQILVDGARPLYTKEDAESKAPRPPLLSRRFVSDAFNWALRTLAGQCYSYTKREIAP